MVTGKHPDGRVAFTSRNLRGLIDYARKHGIAKVTLGECISGDGLYEAQFGNGVICKDSFADPRIMLGFFLGRGAVEVIECERTVFNKGSAMGRINVVFMPPLGRDGSMRFGPWVATAYRDEQQVPMVRLVRD